MLYVYSRNVRNTRGRERKRNERVFFISYDRDKLQRKIRKMYVRVFLFRSPKTVETRPFRVHVFQHGTRLSSLVPDRLGQGSPNDRPRINFISGPQTRTKKTALPRRRSCIFLSLTSSDPRVEPSVFSRFLRVIQFVVAFEVRTENKYARLAENKRKLLFKKIITRARKRVYR